MSVSTPLRKTFAEIDLGSLKKNLRTLKSYLNPKAFLCPMVKGDAYGHGAIEVSKVLESESVSALGVALVEEGVELRKAGIKVPILVFSISDEEGADTSIQNQLTPVFSSWSHVKAFEKKLDRGSQFPVHIEFDTGMGRMGFEEEQAPKLSEYFLAQDKMLLKGLCTHFLAAEDYLDFNSRTHRQLQDYLKIEQAFFGFDKLVSHASNSSAVFLGVQGRESSMFSAGNLIGARPGIGLYGGTPSSNSPLSVSLEPVMTLKSQVDIVRRLKTGQTVSYGGNWKATRPSIVGLIPFGYADGYPRSLFSKGVALFREREVSVIGNVCMDSVIVDLTDVFGEKEPQEGEEVVFWGRQGEALLSIDTVANKAGTISYEIMTGVSKRVPRCFTGSTD